MMRSNDYDEAEAALRDDPVVQRMARDLRHGQVTKSSVAHEDGAPRFEFLQRANSAYRRFGGTGQAHLGAVASAVLTLAFDTPPSRHLLTWRGDDGHRRSTILEAVSEFDLACELGDWQQRTGVGTFHLGTPDDDGELGGTGRPQ